MKERKISVPREIRVRTGIIMGDYKDKKEYRKKVFNAVSAIIGQYMWRALKLEDDKERAKNFKWFIEAIGMGRVIDIGYNYKMGRSIYVGRPIKVVKKSGEEELWAVHQEPQQETRIRRVTEIRRGEKTGRWLEKEVKYYLSIARVKYKTAKEKDEKGKERETVELVKCGRNEWTFGEIKINWQIPEDKTEKTSWTFCEEIETRHESSKPKKLYKDDFRNQIEDDRSWDTIDFWARDNAERQKLKTMCDTDGEKLISLEKESYYDMGYEPDKGQTLKERLKRREEIENWGKNDKN